MKNLYLKLVAAAALATTAWVSAETLVSEISEPKAAVGVLAAGEKRAADVALKFKEIPQVLAGKTLVTIPRGMREKEGQGFQFTMLKNATVYLFLMDRGKPTPPAGWTKTDLKATFFFDASGTFQDFIYSKDFSAGEKVVVPLNDGKEAGSYGVPHCAVVVPKG